MIIKILGSGCNNCKKLEDNAKVAVNELGLDATIEKVEDLVTIMKYGVMKTPALVVDEKVILKGRLATVKELKELLV